MNRFKKAAIVVLAGSTGLWSFEPAEDSMFLGISAGMSQAEARVGRPLSPVSYAGVARRTSRRVARRTAVRVNSLPPGCVYGTYYGGTYWNCGGAFYAQSGGVYIQVVFD
jgi:hypothetical protein